MIRSLTMKPSNIYIYIYERTIYFFCNWQDCLFHRINILIMCMTTKDKSHLMKEFYK
jgi:hypothetical protein